MLKKQDYLRINLKSTKAQIKSLHSQNFTNKLELQCAKAKLNMYDPKYKYDFKIKQQHEKCRRVQED